MCALLQRKCLVDFFENSTILVYLLTSCKRTFQLQHITVNKKKDQK